MTVTSPRTVQLRDCGARWSISVKQRMEEINDKTRAAGGDGSRSKRQGGRDLRRSGAVCSRQRDQSRMVLDRYLAHERDPGADRVSGGGNDAWPAPADAGQARHGRADQSLSAGVRGGAD